MTGRLDKRLLIGLAVFGVAYAVTGLHWLSAGTIVIRKAPSDGPVVGAIGANSVLYYPLCGIWIGLGVSMVALSILSFFSSRALYLKLSSFSFLAILLLGLGTLAAAIRAGP